MLYFVLLVAELLVGDLGSDNALAGLLALVVAVVVVESDDGWFLYLSLDESFGEVC